MFKFVDIFLDNSLVLDVDGLSLSRSLDQSLGDENRIVLVSDDQGLEVVELLDARWG